MTGFDTAVLSFINGIVGRFLLVDWVFTFFSEFLIYILAGVFLLFLFRIKSWKHRANILSLGILAVILSRGIVTPIIRFFFETSRPFVALGVEPLISHGATPSFPSGHMTFIIPVILTLWYINRRAGAWSFGGAFLIAVGGVGALIHWPTDILGGDIDWNNLLWVCSSIIKTRIICTNK